MQRNDEERKCQKRAALVFIHGHSQIAKTNAEEGVRKIEPAHRVDVTARGVNGGFVRQPEGQTNYKSRTTDSADGSADSKYLESKIPRRHLVGEHDKFPGGPLG